tara:strand:- start:1046 stop:1450 length:405 start_codon:yes stop_codon:yes gene_type:complete
MKKSDLKKIIKPLVKECINEVLIEEGVLSNIVSEVARGMNQSNVVIESAPAPKPERSAVQPRSADLTAKRKKLMDAIGSDAYNGVNLFEDTQPMTGYEAAEPKPGSVDLGDPRDSGVDISSIMGGASRMWEAMK